MTPKDFRQVIQLWPSLHDLAEEVGEKRFTVEKWRTRNAIPGRAWRKLASAAKARRLPVTTDLLASLAEESA